MPQVPQRWQGQCQTGEEFSNSCNKYEAEERTELPTLFERTLRFKSPRDSSGHSSHTASTAAGRHMSNMNYNGLGGGEARGGATMAQIAVYKTCWDSGPNAPQEDYFSDAISVGSFHAINHGILVVASAGNAGTRSSATNLAPWMLTVAASSTDREFASDIVLGNGERLMGESLNTFKMKAPTRVISGSDANRGYFTPYQSSFCLDGSLNKTKTREKVIICRHSGSLTELRQAKSIVVKKVKGVGMILIDETENDVAISFPLAATVVGSSDGERLLSYTNKTRKTKSIILRPKAVLGSRPAPCMAAFSSKGPNSLTPEILKPDITAPGLNILAAWSPASRKMNYNILSGTSMSCPHVTGLVALIKAVYPSWSPSAIKSAIMTTATMLDRNESAITADHKGRVANPFDYGSGFLDPSRFLDPGFIYDARPTEYKAFLCSIGYSDGSMHRITGHSSRCTRPVPTASDFNYPSITVPNLQDSYSATRTVTNVGKPRSVYRAQVIPPSGINITVVPKVLVFRNYCQKMEFKVNFRAMSPSKDYVFGSLSWLSKENQVTSPLVVQVLS